MSRSHPKHYRPPPRNAQGHQLAPIGKPIRGRLRLRHGDEDQIAEAMRHAEFARYQATSAGTQSDDWLELGDYYENLAREAKGLEPLPVAVHDVVF